MLAGLGHRAVGGGNHQDGAVHLRSTGDHVLDVVGVARAVDVGVVTLVGLVLDVSGGDGDAALALFRCVVDLVERLEYRLALACQNLGDRSGQGGLAVVDVTDGPDVYVSFVSFKFSFCHVGILPNVYDNLLCECFCLKNGAHNRIRTGDLFLTKEVLYLLSYVGLAIIGAGNGTRTRDPQLGRLTL